ncbi:kinase-like domain-containing protein [Baffinella frigidus]|nr:kinase-like domain-containing protein [Cryptophyta sp. CCMP2293]
MNGHAGVAVLLLDAGANVAAKNAEGETALHLAACNGHKGVARMLLDAGADLASIDHYAGKTALDLAEDCGHEGVARVLRDAWRARSAARAVPAQAGAHVPGHAEAESERRLEEERREAESERRVEEERREAAAMQEAAASEREGILEAARVEAQREAAAIQDEAREFAERERVGMLDAARIEVEEAGRTAAAMQLASSEKVGEAQREAAAIQREARESAESASGRMLEEVAATLAAAQQEAAGIVEAAQGERGGMLHSARIEVEEARRVRKAAETGRAGMLRDAVAKLAAAEQQAAGIVEEAERGRVAAQAAALAVTEAATAAAAAVVLASGRQVRVLFYGELEAATEGFSIDRRIGGGGFGNVYKAVGLQGMGECAVKRLEERSMQGQREFLQELQMLGGCRHKNLLTLLAFSADRGPGDGGGVCLVSPLMLGGSLDDRLFPLAEGAPARLALLGVPPQPAPLQWNVRLRIGVEIASALEYLHSVEPGTHKPQVFHRDVKPANVLLDADLHVRLGDVGLARALPEGGTHITTQVAGTSGFIDQNYQTTGHFDESCDGFSFGVVLLMLFTGRKTHEKNLTLIESCMGRSADLLRDLRCGWPLPVAEEVLAVARALIMTPRSGRISIPEARLRLEASAADHLVAPRDQGGAVERECIICWAPPTVRFGCGHSFLCAADACLGAWLAEHKPCAHCGVAVEQGHIEQGAHVAQQDTYVAPFR